MKEVYSWHDGSRTHITLDESTELPAMTVAVAHYLETLQQLSTAPTASDTLRNYHRQIHDITGQYLDKLLSGDRKIKTNAEIYVAHGALTNVILSVNAARVDPEFFGQLVSDFEDEHELATVTQAAESMVDPLNRTIVII